MQGWQDLDTMRPEEINACAREGGMTTAAQMERIQTALAPIING